MFTPKYLWKYLSDRRVMHIIRIVLFLPIFGEKMVIMSYALLCTLTLKFEYYARKAVVCGTQRMMGAIVLPKFRRTTNDLLQLFPFMGIFELTLSPKPLSCYRRIFY